MPNVNRVRGSEGVGTIAGINSESSGMITRPGSYSVEFQRSDFHSDESWDHKSLRGKRVQYYIEDLSRPVAKGVRLL